MADTLVMAPSQTSPDDGRAPKRPSSKALRRTFAVLSCVVVALVALLIVELVRGPAQSSTQSLSTGAAGSASDPAAQSSAALQAAIDEGPALFSYDYRHLAKDLAAAKADTTGAFTSQYTSVTEPAVSPLATKYKVVVVAVVRAATVTDGSNPKQIKVMLFLNQTVTNTQLAAPRLDANRVIMTMTPVGKTWKVSAVSAI